MSRYDLERQFKEDTYTLATVLSPSECKQPNWMDVMQQDLARGARTMRVLDNSAGIEKMSGPDRWQTPTMHFEIKAILATHVPKANPGIEIDTTTALPEYNPSDIGTCKSHIPVAQCDVILMGDGMHSRQVVPAAQASETITRHQSDLTRLDRMLEASSFLARMNFQLGGNNSEMAMAARHMFGDHGLYSAEPREGAMGAFDALAKQLLNMPINIYALETIMHGETRYCEAFARAEQLMPDNPAYAQAYAVHESLKLIQAEIGKSNPQVQRDVDAMTQSARENVEYARTLRDGIGQDQAQPGEGEIGDVGDEAHEDRDD